MGLLRTNDRILFMDEIFLCLFDNKHYDFIHHTRICSVFDFNLCLGKVGVRLPFILLG